MILPASYSNGFAPRDGQPLYPELWRGCVGSWAPCLGPSGLVLRDHSGFGNHGTLTNGPTWQASYSRYAIDFDGSNDRVEAYGSSRVQHAEQMTFSAWIRPVTVVSQQTIAATWALSVNSGWQFVLMSGGVLSIAFLNQDTSGYYFATSTSLVSSDRWTHVAALTTTGTAAGIRLFINGIESGTTPTTIGVDPGSLDSRELWIGMRKNGSGDTPFFGLIDDLRITMASSVSLVKLLASRRGIAYELAPRRRSSIQVPANITRYNLFTGSSAIQIIGGAS